MPKRRRFTAEFKAQVVLEVLTGVKSAAQVCREHAIKDTVLSRWKQELFDDVATQRLLAPGPSTRSRRKKWPPTRSQHCSPHLRALVRSVPHFSRTTADGVTKITIDKRSSLLLLLNATIIVCAGDPANFEAALGLSGFKQFHSIIPRRHCEEASMNLRRLLLVDPHPDVRRALIARLAHIPGIEVAGAVGHSDEALSMADRLQPDIVLLEPKQLDAHTLIRHLREVAPDSCIVIYTSYPDLWEEEELLSAGASAYLIKTLDLSSLCRWFREPRPPADGSCDTLFFSDTDGF